VTLAVVGLAIAASTLGVMQYADLTWDTTVARTMGLTVIGLASIFLSLEVNDNLRSVFSRETFENGKLIQMSGFSLLAIFLVTQLDLLQRIFDTTSLTLTQWLICIAAATLVIWLVEVMKIFRRRAAGRPSAPQPVSQGGEYRVRRSLETAHGM
jgi:Ca2+-transporting ATPase